MLWWILDSSAQRPPSRPSQNQYSHSGRLRSIRSVITRLNSSLDLVPCRRATAGRPGGCASRGRSPGRRPTPEQRGRTALVVPSGGSGGSAAAVPRSTRTNSSKSGAGPSKIGERADGQRRALVDVLGLEEAGGERSESVHPITLVAPAAPASRGEGPGRVGGAQGRTSALPPTAVRREQAQPMASRPIDAVDTIWLNMDRANNLMVIESLMMLEGQVDWDRFLDVLQQRVLDVYPVFSQRAVPARSAAAGSALGGRPGLLAVAPHPSRHAAGAGRRCRAPGAT